MVCPTILPYITVVNLLCKLTLCPRLLCVTEIQSGSHELYGKAQVSVALELHFHILKKVSSTESVLKL